MFCPECGYRIEELSKFCESCGYALSSEDIKILNEELGSDIKTVIVDAEESEYEKVISDNFSAIDDNKDTVIDDNYDDSELEADIDDDDLSYYLERIKELEIKNKMYRTKCHVLQETLKNLEDSAEEITKLKSENESLKSQVNDLTEKNTEYQAKIKDISDKMCIISDSFSACSDSIESIISSLEYK